MTPLLSHSHIYANNKPQASGFMCAARCTLNKHYAHAADNTHTILAHHSCSTRDTYPETDGSQHRRRRHCGSIVVVVVLATAMHICSAVFTNTITEMSMRSRILQRSNDCLRTAFYTRPDSMHVHTHSYSCVNIFASKQLLIVFQSRLGRNMRTAKRAAHKHCVDDDDDCKPH